MMRTEMVVKWNALSEDMFQDLIKEPDVDVYYAEKPLAGKIRNMIRMIHLSRTIDRHIHLPFKSIWFDPGKMFPKAKNGDLFLFINDTLMYIDTPILMKIHRYFPDSKMVLLIWDSLRAGSLNLEFTKKTFFDYPWDLILSYDQNDCRDYGFHYLGQSYYSKKDVAAPTKAENDIYYIGHCKSNKDVRTKQVLRIFKGCRKAHVACDFTITNMQKPQARDGLVLQKNGIPYDEVVKGFQNSRCILEVLQKGQQQQSLRYFEAVCYNKKLLTNNPDVVNLSYYRPDYMQYFEKPEDIDYDWIKEPIEIDYHYQGEFSPLRSLEMIKHLLYGNQG